MFSALSLMKDVYQDNLTMPTSISSNNLLMIPITMLPRILYKRTLVHLMTHIFDLRSGETVYDPICGSGFACC